MRTQRCVAAVSQPRLKLSAARVSARGPSTPRETAPPPHPPLAPSSLQVRIAMAPAMEVDSLHGVDSLNVNVAAAIVLERIFAFNRAEPADE